jgi:hypothetical protein
MWTYVIKEVSETDIPSRPQQFNQHNIVFLAAWVAKNSRNADVNTVSNAVTHLVDKVNAYNKVAHDLPEYDTLIHRGYEVAQAVKAVAELTGATNINIHIERFIRQAKYGVPVHKFQGIYSIQPDDDTRIFV